MTDAESSQQTATLTIDEALRQAIAHHQSGHLQDAERLYRAILQAQSEHPDANHNLGVLAVQVNQPAAALPHFKAALEANPSQGQYWLSYADALLATGQAKEALNILRDAMKRGFNTAAAQAMRQKAEAAYQSAHPSDSLDLPGYKKDQPQERSAEISLAELLGAGKSAVGKGRSAKNARSSLKRLPKKTLPQAEIDQLLALFNAGRHAEVEKRAHELLEQYPATGFIWKVLGVSLQMLGKEALPAMQKAAELSPDDAEAHSNLGNALRELGQFDSAVASHRRALRINPGYAEGHSNLGNVLENLGQLEDAVTSYRRALELKPDFAEAHSNLAKTLFDLGDMNQAIIAYQKTLAIDPGHFGLDAAVWLGIMYYLEGDIAQCRSMLIASQQIMATIDAKRETGRIYRDYLARLMAYYERYDSPKTRPEELDHLYVIGESHSLSAHRVPVRYRAQEMLCNAEWVAGCKQWHLGNDKANQYKHKFDLAMAKLPRQSPILLTIGEIDCRPDEGIIGVVKKSPDKTLEGIALATTSAYVAYVSRIAAQYGHRIIISGVPATNIQLDTLAPEVAEQLVSLIRIKGARVELNWPSPLMKQLAIRLRRWK